MISIHSRLSNIYIPTIHFQGFPYTPCKAVLAIQREKTPEIWYTRHLDGYMGKVIINNLIGAGFNSRKIL
jgi:hypothetical protein